jgi:hypothetical protein
LKTATSRAWGTWNRLGDLLGSLTYFGQCARCGVQFMSTHELVYVLDGSKHCERCGRALARPPWNGGVS